MVRRNRMAVSSARLGLNRHVRIKSKLFPKGSGLVKEGGVTDSSVSFYPGSLPRRLEASKST